MFNVKRQRGFTLLELVVALIIGSTLAVAGVRTVQQKALETRRVYAIDSIRLIQEASMAYYVNTGAWPASIATLTGANYLPATFPTNNPWGNAYTLSISGSDFVITTNASTAANAGMIAAAVPAGSASTSTVTSSIVVPGTESSHAGLLDLAGTRTMTGDLKMGSKNINNANYVTVKRIVDSDDSNYYLDPNGLSWFSDLRTWSLQSSEYLDRDNTAYKVDPNSTSNVNRIDASDMRSSIFYDKDNTGFYVNPDYQSNMNEVWATAFYERGGSPTYYVKPQTTSRMGTIDADSIRDHTLGDLAKGYSLDSEVDGETLIPKPNCPSSFPTPRIYVAPVSYNTGSKDGVSAVNAYSINYSATHWQVRLEVYLTTGTRLASDFFLSNTRLHVTTKCE